MDKAHHPHWMSPGGISFDRIAHLYDETRRLPPDQMEVIVDALYRELSRYHLVLEVGVGTGRIAVPLQRRGLHLIGVDIAPRMLERGRGKGLRDILLADALRLPFKDRFADAVYSVHVLHLIRDWRGALKEMARVAREAYYTIATYRQEANSPHRRYWEVVREAGFERQTPGIYERELPDIIPARERVVLGTFQERLQASEMIRDLEGRVYSGQWSLPDEVHKRALEAVKAEFSDEEVVLRKRVELIRWDVEDLTQG